MVWEREQRLRQALAAMGLRDLAYWTTWHLYQVRSARPARWARWARRLRLQGASSGHGAAGKGVARRSSCATVAGLGFRA